MIAVWICVGFLVGFLLACLLDSGTREDSAREIFHLRKALAIIEGLEVKGADFELVARREAHNALKEEA